MSEEVKEAKVTKRELRSEIERLTKELDAAKKTSDMWYKDRNNLTNELDGLHSVVDGIVDAMPRTKEDGYTKNPINSRLLSAFIVMAKS